MLIVESRNKPAGDAYPRPHSIYYWGNRFERNPADGKDHQRSFTRRIHAGTYAEPLYTRFAHPFVKVRRVN